MLLRRAYALAGVGEYWLVDVRADQIRFEILVNVDGTCASSSDPAAPQESRVLGGRWHLTRRPNRAQRFTYDLTRRP